MRVKWSEVDGESGWEKACRVVEVAGKLGVTRINVVRENTGSWSAMTGVLSEALSQTGSRHRTRRPEYRRQSKWYVRLCKFCADSLCRHRRTIQQDRAHRRSRIEEVGLVIRLRRPVDLRSLGRLNHRGFGKRNAGSSYAYFRHNVKRVHPYQRGRSPHTGLGL